MNRESALSDIREVFEDVMDVDPAEVTIDSTADDVEGWDSLSHVRLMVALERRFGVRFSNGEIEGVTTVRGLLDLLERKAAA